jgi:hypothetical protein
MNALRIRRRLDAPIPELPELAPMIGKTVEIIVIDDTESGASPAYDFWKGPTADELAAKQGVLPITSLDQLQGKQDMTHAFDGFEETLVNWRHEPWRKEGE